MIVRVVPSSQVKHTACLVDIYKVKDENNRVLVSCITQWILAKMEIIGDVFISFEYLDVIRDHNEV